MKWFVKEFHAKKTKFISFIGRLEDIVYVLYCAQAPFTANGDGSYLMANTQIEYTLITWQKGFRCVLKR